MAKRPEKTIDAVAAGHLCLDIFHPDHARQMELVEAIQPGTRYEGAGNLRHITNPLTPELRSLVEAYIAEAQQSGGWISTGGGVSNVGIPLVDLFQGNARLMAKVGSDPIADAIGSFLAEKAPEAAALQRVEGEDTSYTIILNPGGGASTVYAHNPGTNDTFTPDDVGMGVVASARMMELSYPNLMAQFYRDQMALAEVAEATHEVHTKFYLDMHSLEEGNEAGNADWVTILKNAGPFIHRFCPSLDEALFIADRELWRQYKAEADRTESKTNRKPDFSEFVEPDILRRVAEVYLKMDMNGVMIKCGPSGLYLRSRSGTTPYWNNAEVFVPGFVAPNIEDTTGAGDNSIAALMWDDSRCYVPFVALRLANAAGFLNVQHKGAVGAFTSGKDLLDVSSGRVELAQPALLSGSYFRELAPGAYFGERHQKPIDG